MSKRILILDDDADFNNLLTDIFSQADYEVVSERDPMEALNRFKQENFDLIVTDQKMPGLSGEEFIREVKAVNGHIPIIMVSGYLDNDTIRDLIQQGVGGVFLKPLNVFSLLKRTAAILEEAETGTGPEAAEEAVRQAGAKGSDYQHSLPFEFSTYPCRSEKTEEFARKLYSLRNFKTNLVFIGEKGAPFVHACEDMQNFETGRKELFVYVQADDMAEQTLKHHLEQASADGMDRMTFVILDTTALLEESRKLVSQITRREGLFEEAAVSVRLIFCLHDDVDNLYDSGMIDDDLYLLLGTSEVRFPALRDIPEDLPHLAQALLQEQAEKQGTETEPRLNKDARSLLRDQEWPGDYAELEALMHRIALQVVQPNIGAAEIEAVLRREKTTDSLAQVSDLRSHLEQYAGDYAAAALTLLRNNEEQAADFLKIDAVRLTELC